MFRSINKLPDRWLIYRPIGKPIDGTRFIPFKTPLKSELCRNLQEDDRFNLQSLIEHVAALKKQLGLIIDLTNTHRYYDADDVQTFGIEYVKICCPGHTIDQREDIVDEFNKIVDEFLARNHDNQDTIIGVHCTHGVNRTGYLIARYLIDRCNWKAETAIEAFERARGHPMERYISSLCSAPVELCNDTRATAPPADPTDDMWYTLMGAEQLIFDSSASQKTEPVVTAEKCAPRRSAYICDRLCCSSDEDDDDDQSIKCSPTSSVTLSTRRRSHESSKNA